MDSVLYTTGAELSPDGVTRQAFLDELNTSAVVQSESAFFADWQNRAAKNYVDLTFTVAGSYVSVLIEVYKAGVLVSSANCNTRTYTGTTMLLSIGSACTNQPLIVEPLVTPKPFALRM